MKDSLKYLKQCEEEWIRLKEKYGQVIITKDQAYKEGVVIGQIVGGQSKFLILKGIWPYDLFQTGFQAGLDAAQSK